MDELFAVYPITSLYELFLTAENNFRRVGISELQKSQVTSLGKTKFDSLELLRGGEWDFFQRRADLNSATPMSMHYK